jgi:hypothetical protein
MAASGGCVSRLVRFLHFGGVGSAFGSWIAGTGVAGGIGWVGGMAAEACFCGGGATGSTGAVMRSGCGDGNNGARSDPLGGKDV